jgi:hypothetical protein
MKKLILTEDDFYQSSRGQEISGGNKRLYEAEVAIFLKRDGSYEVLKDRFGLSKTEIEMELEGIDNRLLLIS